MFPPVTCLCGVFFFPKLCKSHYNLLCGHCIMGHKQFSTFALFDAGICMRILLFPSMPHTRNTRRVKKPLPHILYNTIGHPFRHCIYVVPQFDFFSLIKGVFPEPTLTQCPPVRLVNLLRLHMNLNMSFLIVKVLVTVGCDTWHLLEINTHFNLVPSCISYCGDKVKSVKKKKLLKPKHNLMVMKSDMIVKLVLPAYILFWTIFM